MATWEEDPEVSGALTTLYPPTVMMIRFGVQPDGKPWSENVTSWVCMSIPATGTVTYNCVPEVKNVL